MTEQEVLTEVNDQLFALLTGAEGFQEFLDELAVMAARRLSVTSEVSCAVTLVRLKKAGTLATSDELARTADEFQNRSHEGPCLEAAERRLSVYCADTMTDPRWPTYLRKVRATPIRSILGVSFALGDSGRAALNLYSTVPSSFDPGAIAAAEALAEAASSSLTFAARAAAADDERHDLEAALESRQTINTAIGIIMFQNSCSHAEALTILQRASNSRNLKLRVVAERVITSIADAEKH
ncbi:GAF and ANTAR domain-containing protein [Arthrobacter agilis]|uniref:GAF and ANTAR domain-containing protein n=1 Tax=Arthrobacter agilis TaxID=37921 RepID=UPI000F6C97D9|nr:GAF and ANTAR domain-containing protein [Arthrobacter agilis]TPV27940.1 GAF and ANTAR domain-containing protein [Arthrobacter agilis]VDR31377.1 ANTAR domain [Arthrobacter agilis]